MLSKKPADDLFEQSSMSFGDHLDELRKALLKAFIWLGIGTAIGLYFSERIVRYFQEPLEKAVYQFQVDHAKKEFKKANGTEPTEELAELISRLGLVPEVNYVDPLVFSMQAGSSGGLDIGPLTPDIQTPDTQTPSETPSPAESQSPPKETPAQAGNTPAASPEEVSQPATATAAAAETDASEVSDASELDNPGPQANPDPKTAADKAAAEKALSGLPVQKLTMADDDNQASLGEATDVVGAVLALPNAWEGVDRDSLSRLRSFIIWKPITTNLVSLDATEGFMIFLKAGLMAGVLIGSPGIFWHIWQFFAAGLYPHERRYVYWYLPLSLLLFLAGFALAFYVIFKLVLGFLMLYTNSLGVAFTPRLTDYMTFALFLPLGFGIAFQLPLAMLGLHRFGVVPVELFISQWRLAVLAIAFLSMILTPAEPYSMIGLAVPLTGLYFLGILLCKYMPKGAGLGSAALDPQN